jgi:hydrogenase maturation protease
MNPHTKRVLVAGIGNLFLTDDGFGSEVARQLVGRQMPAGVKVVDFGIRGMHLAYELLDGYDALVVVDALPGDGAPGDLSVLQVGPDDLGEGELDAHGMAPVAVLASLGQLGGSLPPTYIVGCQPADVSEGIGLTQPVAAAVEPAVELVLDVLQEQVGLSGPSVQGSAYVESTSSVDVSSSVEFDREDLP